MGERERGAQPNPVGRAVQTLVGGASDPSIGRDDRDGRAEAVSATLHTLQRPRRSRACASVWKRSSRRDLADARIGRDASVSAGTELTLASGGSEATRRAPPAQRYRRRSEKEGADPGSAPAPALSTTLVPTAASDLSRTSTSVDAMDDLDAHGRIDTGCMPAGGRKVAGSNPAAPTYPQSLRGDLEMSARVLPSG
jgi:hypothetical protein